MLSHNRRQITKEFRGMKKENYGKLSFISMTKKAYLILQMNLMLQKKINQLYENMKIHLKITKPPPEIFFPQKKEIATQVYWNKKKAKMSGPIALQ